MKRLALTLLLWLAAQPAAAQRVEVVSGAHDGFVRLALVLPGASDWRLTRTSGGYALEVDQAGLRFDLSDVFRPIPRDRLSAIWVDPEDGTLQLGVACACHAIPFELRPGVIVIDLRDGPPPAGSAFELGSDGKTLEPLATRIAQRPRQRPAMLAATTGDPRADTGVQTAGAAGAAAAASGSYDWLDRFRADPAGPPGAPPSPSVGGPLPAVASLADGADLQRQLLQELARAAARGSVTMTDRPPEPVVLMPAGAMAQLNIGGVAAAVPGLERDEAEITGDGTPCLPDTAVDLASWGGDGPAAAQIGAVKAGVLGEFDRPDPAAVARLVRLHLHLGFGAEARQLAEAFAAEDPSRPVWDTLALIIDGKAVPQGVFTGAETCDGWVALWAVLAQPDLPATSERKDGAVLRAFSALPAHLRRHLGPPLADRYLAAGLDRPVQAIRDAIERTPGPAGAAARLLDADLAAARDEPVADATLRALAAEPGEPGLRATLAAIRATASAGEVPAELTLAAEALRRIHDGTEEAAALDAALALARASQGDFAAAFALVPAESEEARPIWALLADRGGEGAVLAWTVRDEAVLLPTDLRLRLAGRLVDLGFAEPALTWIGPSELSLAKGRLLLAEAELLRGDALAAARALSGLEGPEAEELRALAQRRLDPAAEVAGDPLQAALARKDWTRIAAEAPTPWSAAAARLAPPPPDPGAGPLARGRALVEESAAARSDLIALLAATSGTASAPDSSD